MGNDRLVQVLVVEDEPDTAEMFAEMMRLSGYAVRQCHGAQTAILSLRRQRPDVVILDIMMPDLSGLEVLRFMRRDPNLHDIPVIIISAKSSPIEIKQGLEAGANTYLTKPITFTELREAVEKVLSGQNTQQG